VKAENLKIYGLDYSSDMVKTAADNNKSSVNSGKLKCGSDLDDNLISVLHGKILPQLEIYRVLKPEEIFYNHKD
jgi:ubiquinone/menaquinone biosynthesis C-methylase UbiE